MNAKQQKQRLQLLRLKEEARVFKTAVLHGAQPSLALFKFAANTKLRQFFTFGVFDSHFQAELYKKMATLPLGDLGCLRKNQDVCDLVFPRNRAALFAFLNPLYLDLLLPFLGSEHKTAFYLNGGNPQAFFYTLGQAHLTLAQADLLPLSFWSTVQSHPMLAASLAQNSPELVPVMEQRTLSAKHRLHCSDEAVAVDAL